MKLLLGVDAGTSFVKSVVFDETGHEVAAARREMPLVHRVANGCEVDMATAWNLTADTIAEVVERVGAETIAGVGVSGTACGFWGISEAGEPTRLAILWNDGRAADVVAEWRKDDFYSRIFELTGNAPFPGYPISTLAWLKQHEPQTLARTRWFLFHKDWLRYNLTGTIGTDISDVSYFPGDLAGRGYHHGLMQEAGLGDHIDRLPPIIHSEQIVGHVSEVAATRTGLAAGTPVVAGAVDVVSSLIGGGAHRIGQACAILGTSLLNTLIIAEPSYNPAQTGVQACLPEGLYARSLVNTSGTLCMDWLVDNLAGEERRSAGDDDQAMYTAIETQVQTSPPGARGLIFLPYLNSAGIISPFASANARGMFFGLSVEHTRADLMRAVYEGVALSMRDCFAVIDRPIEEILLVGGGARSAFWAQLFADVTGRRIVIANGTEFGARGAAILVGVGAGLFPDVATGIDRYVRNDRMYEPRPHISAIYDIIYPLYRHLYQHASPAWDLRASILRQIDSI